MKTKMRVMVKRAMSLLLTVVLLFGSAPLSGFVGLDLPSLPDLPKLGEMNLDFEIPKIEIDFEIPEFDGLKKIANSVSGFFKNFKGFSFNVEAAVTSGSCGENLTWSIDEVTGTLTISGSGEMKDWDRFYDSPWYSYREKITSIVIGDSVTSIGKNAFNYCYTLTSVTVGNSVTVIGESAFNGCDNLITLIMGNNLLAIGKKAFYECESLTSITIPDTVVNIGDFAFERCTNLKNITIPASVTNISSTAFSQCCNLLIEVEDSNKYYASNETGSLLNKDKTELLFTTITGTVYNVPEGIVKIGDYAFSSNPISGIYLCQINFPASLKEIGAYAFCGVSVQKLVLPSNLEVIGEAAFCAGVGDVHLELPDSLISIGKDAFAGCKKLYSVKIGSNLEEIGLNAFNNCSRLMYFSVNPNNRYFSADESGVLFDKNKTTLIRFPLNTNLTEYNIPDGVKTIYQYAFCAESSTKLEKVTMPDSLEFIGESAFCEIGLSYLNIPVNVKTIESNAFVGCNGTLYFNARNCTNLGENIWGEKNSKSILLKNIIVGNKVEYLPDYVFARNSNYVVELESLVFEENSVLKTIGDCAFYKIGFPELKLPDSLETIGSSAFYGTCEFTDVIIPDSVKTIKEFAFYDCDITSLTFERESQLTTIEKGAFGDSCITSLVLPDTVTVLGESCFSNCDYLTYVDLPNALKEISIESFYSCDNLQSVIIPDSVSIIKASAFKFCESLRSINIPNSVITIEDDAFTGSGLRKITLPESLENLGDSFRQCESLKTVEYNAINCTTTKNISDDPFFFYSPFWYSPVQSIIIGDTVTIIPNGLFAELDNLGSKEISIPSSVTKIMSGAFYNLTGTMIKFESPINVIEIGEAAFYNADISKVQLGDFANLVSIEAKAFRGCITSSDINIPEKVTFIGSEAFYNCDTLKSITILGKVETIAKKTFYSCELLEKVKLSEAVTSIEESAFEGCSIEDIILPDSLVSLGYRAFAYCDFYQINIPVSVETISDKVFYQCLNLEEVIYSAKNCTNVGKDIFTGDLAYLSIENTVEYIGRVFSGRIIHSLFYDTDKLATCNMLNGYSTLTVGENVKTIPSYLGSASLLSVEFAENCLLETIGENAFASSVLLTKITLPKTVETINAKAFYGCTNLFEINIHDNITEIGNSAFANCTNLMYVCINENMKTIGESAFSKSGLKAVDYNAVDCEIGKSVWNSVNPIDLSIGESVLSIPAGGFASSSIYNVDFGTQSKVEVIPESAFSGTKIQAIKLPSSVRSIDYMAFSGCGLLTSIVIPEQVKAIYYHTFYNCKSLTSVYIPNNFSYVDLATFEKCESLTTVYYGGTSQSFSKIKIEAKNDCFKYAEKIWNSVPSDVVVKTRETGSVKLSENLLLLDVGDIAYIEVDISSNISQNELKWQTLDSNIITISELGEVTAVKPGYTFVIVTDKETGAWDRCAVFVGKPNELNLYSEHDSRYYFGGNGFYSNTCQISDTVDIYLAMENKLKPELKGLTTIPEFGDALSQVDMSDVKITATVSGSGLSFKEGSYSNTYTQTYEKIPAGKAIDDMIMLYPYNVEDNAGEYTVTVKFESDDFEEFTETFTFTLSNIEDKVVDDHIDFVNNNATYRVYKIADFASEMADVDKEGEYLWAKYTNLDFKNYYDVMFADVLLKMMDVNQSNITSIAPVIEEWVGAYKKVLKGITNIVEENYSEIKPLDITESNLGKLLKKSKYTAKGMEVEDELRDAVVDVLSGKVSDGTVNKCFAVADKTGQVFGLLKFGANVVKGVMDCFDNIAIINAYQEMENEFKDVIEYVYNQIPASEKQIKNAVGHFTSLGTTWTDGKAESIMKEFGKLSVDLAVDSYKYIFGSFLKDAIIKAIGNITLKSGALLSTTAAFKTFSNVAGSVSTGYTLGVCLSNILCDTSGQAEEMGKLVAAAKFAPYIIKALSYYETSMRAYKTVASVKRFENAFALHKAVQVYCMEHTYETLRIQSTNLAIKILEALNWYSTKNYVNTMNDIAAKKTTLSLCNCCLTDLEATKVTRTKTIAVKCPVDVYIYDNEGNEVVRIINNVVEYCAYGITVLINGSEKYITVPATQDYEVKIVATDSGTMSYSVTEYDETAQRVSFVNTDNIVLVDGKVFRGTINDDVLPSASTYALKSGGTTINPTEAAKTPVTNIEISKSSVSTTTGSKVSLTATITPDNATIKDVIWASSNENVAVVDENGTVTAISQGNAIITATSKDGGYYDTCDITVEFGEPIVLVTGVTLSQTALSLKVGASANLSANIMPVNATDKTVQWSSDNTRIASVDENGKVTAIGIGTAYITVTTIDGSYTATCKVMVSSNTPTHIPVSGVSLSSDALSLNIDDTHRLTVTIKPSNATNIAINWSSSNTKVATVNAYGVVTAVGAGSATIYVRTVDGGYSDSCEVKVVNPDINCTLAIKSPSTTKVNYGDTLVLHADLGETQIPEGYKIEWIVEGTGMSFEPSEDGLTCKVTSIQNGKVTVVVRIVSEDGETLLDANGEELSVSQELTSNVTFWQKIVSFFKNLFRISRIILQAE